MGRCIFIAHIYAYFVLHIFAYLSDCILIHIMYTMHIPAYNCIFPFCIFLDIYAY